MGRKNLKTEVLKEDEYFGVFKRLGMKDKDIKGAKKDAEKESKGVLNAKKQSICKILGVDEI